MKKSLIHEFMPEYRMRQIDRMRVKAPPHEAWPVVRAFDIQSGLISRILFALRTLPDRLSHKLKGPNLLKSPASGIEGFTGPGKGFQILGEDPGREVVIGSAGKFWKLKIAWAGITTDNFKAFNTFGFGKLAWNLRVDPDSFGGSWITWELRVTATDDQAWSYFRLYWSIIGRFSHWLRKSALSKFHRQLGAPTSEENFQLPGDELVPLPRYQKTMSTTIESPPYEVWPWLIQMGCRRGGWYSIDHLDNGGVPSAQQIIPDLQCIQVGQILPWRPKGDDGFAVLGLHENEALILGSASLLKDSHRQNDPFKDTWTFVLESIGEEATRLITRVRADYCPSWKMSFMNLWLRFAHWVMERAQLSHLNQRISTTANYSPVLMEEAPYAQFRSQVSVDVQAQPEWVLQEFGHVTPKEMPLAWLIGEIRYLPARLLGHHQPRVDKNEPLAKGLIESGSLVLLSSPREIVMVSAGKFHQIINQEFVRFNDVEEFRQFTDSRYQKLFISIRVVPAGANRSRLTLEHWTWALSEESRRQFARYWKIIRPSGNFVSRLLLRAAKRRAEAARSNPWSEQFY